MYWYSANLYKVGGVCTRSCSKMRKVVAGEWKRPSDSMPPPKKVCKGSSREHFISPYILHCAFVFQIVDHTFIGLLIHTTSETAIHANAWVLYSFIWAIAHLSRPWYIGWVALSFLLRRLYVRPALVTFDQISTFFNMYRHKGLVLREEINWRKKFSFGHCPIKGGGAGSTYAQIFWPSF